MRSASKILLKIQCWWTLLPFTCLIGFHSDPLGHNLHPHYHPGTTLFPLQALLAILQHKCEFYGVTISTNVSSKNAFSVEQLDRNMHVQKKKEMWNCGWYVLLLQNGWNTAYQHWIFKYTKESKKERKKKSMFWL